MSKTASLVTATLPITHLTKLAIAMIVAAACDGGSGGSSGTMPITEAQAEEVCTTKCQGAIDCGSGQELGACVTSCMQIIVGWARADAVDAVFSCTAALACDASEDACIDDVLPLAIHHEWERRCRAELAECLEPAEIEGLCEASPGSGNFGIRFISPPIIEEMIDCLAAPECETRFACLQDVFATYNIDA